jgi:hypothetical protein
MFENPGEVTKGEEGAEPMGDAHLCLQTEVRMIQLLSMVPDHPSFLGHLRHGSPSLPHTKPASSPSRCTASHSKVPLGSPNGRRGGRPVLARVQSTSTADDAFCVV